MKRKQILLLEAAGVVVLVGVAKFIAHSLGAEVLELNSLFTSMIGGAIFLFGLILSGTLSDYKEADRVPAELVTALESIREEVRATAEKNELFDPGPALDALAAIPRAFHHAINHSDYEPAHEAISALTPVFLGMEASGALPQYMSRLRADQSSMRRHVLRVSHVQRIEFLPSAHTLLTTIVVLVIGILVFTGIEPLRLSLVLVSFVTFLFYYVLRLLHLLERPFRPSHETRDDVSLYLLDEFVARLAEDGAAVDSGTTRRTA